MDFSSHILKITEYGDIGIYEFKKPDTNIHGLTFIVGKNVTTVTGDFGNWVFCREFHPEGGSAVSRGYWDEKLEILSVQQSHKYDSDQTLKKIKEFENEFEDWYGRTLNNEEMEWIESLYDTVEDEHKYTYTAYREKPSTIDYEYIPFGKKRHVYLDIVYDAFNEICNTLKKEK